MTHPGALVFAAALLPTTLAGPTEAQDANGIIRRHVAALGGSEALEGIEAMRYVRIVQNTEEGGTTRQSRAVFFSKRPYFHRSENLETGSLYLSDGTRAWRGTRISDENDVRWEETPRILPLRELDFDRPFGPFIDFETKGHEASYVGVALVDGISVEAIRVMWSDGEEWEYYFDSSTGLCRGYDASPGVPGGLVLTDDYRRVGDVLIPHRNAVTDTLPDGSVRLHERLYAEFELNPAFPEGFFQPGPRKPGAMLRPTPTRE